MGLLKKPEKEKKGIKILIYGKSGVGKSYFALSFPKNVVLDTEDGTCHYVNNPNIAYRLVTTSAQEIEESINEIKDDLIDNIETVTLDTETKMYENLQHSALVVVERRARMNGRSAFAETLSVKEWGKIKLIHKRITSKLIELSGFGKNIVVVTQLADEKEKMGDEFVKVGEKPNAIKGIEYDFDIILKLCFDDVENKRYGIIEKDRTGTYNIGETIDDPSFSNWEHIFNSSKKLKASNINLTKNIETDTKEFESDDLEGIVKEIKSVMKKKLTSKELDTKKIKSILGEFSISTPDDIEDIETAKNLLEKL